MTARRRTTRPSELETLRKRLAEAEQTLAAIRSGEVDSLVVETRAGLRVYTLESANNPYRVMIEAISEGAVTLTEDGLILYSNRRFARMLDRPLQRVMGASFRDLVPARARADLDALLRSALERESRSELPLLGDGGEVPAYLSVSSIEDDGRRALCLVATDLRAQKRSEDILAAEKLARSVLEQAAEAIVVCDERGAIIRASAAAAELCGCAPMFSTFERIFPLRLSGRPEGGGDGDGDGVVGLALRGEVLRAVPATLRTAAGRGADVLVSAGPLHGAAGGVIGCVIALVDVTQSRRAQREAEEALRQAITLRDQFLSVASHELRTPLTALSLQLEGLERMLLKELPGHDRAVGKARSAIRQTDRLGLLVEGLLNVARIVSGQFELQLERFDLAEVVRETLERMGDLAHRAGCELRLATHGSAMGTWDRSRLEQVVTNLLTNAIKYGAGSPIDVALQQEDGAVELRVHDRGIGIPDEDQARIFERFERAVPTTHYGGLGLGLYISREIAVAHGGSIQVQSAPGHGATFRVRLPVTAQRGSVREAS